MISALDSIRDQLSTYWYSSTYKQSANLWKHEWSRHGKCTGLSQLKYFQQTLSLFLIYRVKCTPFNQFALARECRLCLDTNFEFLFVMDYQTRRFCPTQSRTGHDCSAICIFALYFPNRGLCHFTIVLYRISTSSC